MRLSKPSLSAVCLGIAALAAPLFGAGDASADIFKTVDEDGVVHFTNTRGQGAQLYAKDRKHRANVVPIMPSDASIERFSRYDEWIRQSATLYQLPEELVRAVIMVESNYDPRALSPAGAIGLMQLMPETAARMEARDPHDPRENIFGGTRYLRILANLFNGDLELTIAGYNAGEGAVIRYGGIPPYAETQDYVVKVLTYYRRYRATRDATAASVGSAELGFDFEGGELSGKSAPALGVGAFRMRLRAFFVLALLASPLAGCAGNTQNVRAYRAYAYEPPSVLVALDRTADIAKSLEVMDKLLLETAYTPGDAWIATLPLTAEESKLLRDDVRQQPPYSEGNYEVPVMKLYRLHLEKVLQTAPAKGKYASLLDAVGDLGGDAKELKAHWQALREKASAFVKADAEFEKTYAAAYPPGSKRGVQDPPEVQAARKARSDAKDEANKAQETLEKDVASIAKSKPDSGDMLKELVVAVSVAYRLELESLAMIPIVAIQAIRSIPDAAKHASDVALIKGVSQLSELPDYIGGIKEKMSREGEVLDLMAKALARAAKTELAETAGFALKESVVDQVVGVTFDSFRFTAKAGGEAFFYNNAKNSTDPNAQQNSGQGQKITKDYTGHLRELKYDVKPILLAAFSANVAFDYIQLPNAGNLSFGFKTSAGANGSIDNNGSLGKQFGASGATSQALDIGLGILGVRTAVRQAQFTAGTVHYVDAASGNDIVIGGAAATGPFQIKYTQIDLGYDIAFLMGESAGKYFIEELTVGGRYFQYALPRILYELECSTATGCDPNADSKTYKYVNESAPQVVTSKYYMGGVTARFGAGQSAWLAPFADLGMYVGAGPSAYYLRKTAPTAANVDSPAQTDLTSSSQTLQNQNAFAANVALALGVRLHLTGASRFRLSGEAQYRAELLYAQTKGNSGSSDPKADRIVDFGGADVFHGPRLSLVGEFLSDAMADHTCCRISRSVLGPGPQN